MDMNLEEQIRFRAYYIWENEGRPNGRDCDHWHQATHELVNDTLVASEVVVSVVTTAQKKAPASRPARATKTSTAKAPAAPKTPRRSVRRDLTLN